MIEEFEKYLKKRKRQKILKKVKRYGIIAGTVLIPVIVLAALHIIKKKAKKKVKQAVKAKVKEQIEKRKS